ncbi:hypothetical protein F9K33_00230 [bacterium]|nr:MAG: hypothetical protein F9K33_00230 [bacterium]
MNLDEKIGQLVIPRLDFNDPEFDLMQAEDLIREFHIGSFIVFGGDMEQVIHSLNRLQSISQQPILFSADLERGLGQQVKGATSFPYFMGLAEAAKKNSVQLIYDVAKITAIESRAVGIHQNFSPVLDINNNRDNPIINIRSFGEDAETVTSCGLAYIKGLQENGMLATAKHFPGHGDTQVDSHRELPRLPHSLSRLEQLAFLPFRRAMDAGVDALMIGHIAVPSLDASGLPATMSKNITTGLIRNQWKYEGLIITDAMMMGAITDQFSEEEAVTKVFDAGVDQMLIPVSTENACGIVRRMVENNSEASARLDKSVERILFAKKKWGLFEHRYTDGSNALKIVGNHEHVQFAHHITQQCFVTKKGIWPRTLSTENAVIWLIQTDRNSFKDLEKKTNDMKIVASVWSDEMAAIPDLSEFRRVVVITDVKPMAWQKKYQLPDVIKNVLESLFQNKEHLLISCGNPYIGDGLKNLKNFVCTFSSGQLAQEEIARRIVG